MPKRELVDLRCRIFHETERAYLVQTDDGAPAEKAWLPIAFVEISDRDGDFAMLTMPEWLAIEKGMI